MENTSHQQISNQRGDDPVNRVVAFAIEASIAAALIAVWHPYGRADSTDLLSAPIRIGWVLSQSIWLIFPGVLIGWWLSASRPRLSSWLSGAWFALVPTLISLDALARGWMDREFLAASTFRILIRWESLRDYITWTNTASALIAVLIPLALLLLLGFARRALGGRSAAWTKISSTKRIVGLFGVSIVLAVPAIWNWHQTRRWLNRHPARNPLCVVPIWNLGNQMARPATVSVSAANPGEPFDTISRRQNGFRLLALDASRSKPRAPVPDVVLVIVESMRHELIDPQAMPNLHRVAQNSLWCRQHFSGGNATTHGMFSLLNGLDPSWYDSPVRFTPLMNRLVRQGGYEIGFFAGHDQWSSFYMDAFIDPQHYDVFQVSAHNGLTSDRRATLEASRFLDEPRDQRPPRMAVLYLYATHAIYSSYPKDRFFQPAADDRLLYPYTESARDSVWNRYRNSARTVDRFLLSVMREDRIVIVTGDHGEAFLEDGTIGHGTRISKVQNETPAIVFVPGNAGRGIDQPTCHADLLPTLVDALGWQLNRSDVLSGMSLLSESSALADRCFATRDYLSNTYGLIGPWTRRAKQPFAFTFKFPSSEGVTERLEPIDESGRPLSVGAESSELIERWSR